MDVFLDHLQCEGQHLLASILHRSPLANDLSILLRRGKMQVNPPLTNIRPHSCSQFSSGDFHLLLFLAPSDDHLGGLGGVTNSLLILRLIPVHVLLMRFEFVISMADAGGLLCSLWRGGAAIVRSGPSEWSSRSQISQKRTSHSRSCCYQ